MKNNKCFARKPYGRCAVLTTCDCKGTSCPFYKTREQFKASKAQADTRLALLDAVTQRIIADKYFDGSFAWNAGVPV